MKTKPTMQSLRRSQAGLSLVELMVAVTLGLMIMAGLASIFASNSAARNEIERSSRQIENGRFAMELITQDLRLAGYFGEMVIGASEVAPTVPDICTHDVATWRAGMLAPIHVFDNGVGVPTCVSGVVNIKPDTDVLVIRRASTCEAGVGDCPVMLPNKPYVQVSRCEDDRAIYPDLRNIPILLQKGGDGGWVNRAHGCVARAGLREYMIRIYFISTDNGQGVNVPTLKRAEYNGNGYTITNLVEGIEELNVNFGVDYCDIGGNCANIDRKLDGQPDVFVADPGNATLPGCGGGCAPVNNWANVVTAKVHLLARNIEESPRYADNKTYVLGVDAGGLEVSVTPGGPYRRHAYSGVARLINVAQRRERP